MFLFCMQYTYKLIQQKYIVFSSFFCIFLSSSLFAKLRTKETDFFFKKRSPHNITTKYYSSSFNAIHMFCELFVSVLFDEAIVSLSVHSKLQYMKYHLYHSYTLRLLLISCFLCFFFLQQNPHTTEKVHIYGIYSKHNPNSPTHTKRKTLFLDMR